MMRFWPFKSSPPESSEDSFAEERMLSVEYGKGKGPHDIIAEKLLAMTKDLPPGVIREIPVSSLSETPEAITTAADIRTDMAVHGETRKPPLVMDIVWRDGQRKLKVQGV